MNIYIVYKTTNIINRKTYIGVHKQSTPEFDGYYGSGVLLRNAIKKYGIENFIRETLFVYDNNKDAYLKESELVTASSVKDRNNYNICAGGIGGVGKTVSLKQRKSNGIKAVKYNKLNKTGPFFNKELHDKCCQKGGYITGAKNASKEGFMSWVNKHKDRSIKYIHITNGIINKMIPKNQKIPSGFKHGRTLSWKFTQWK